MATEFELIRKYFDKPVRNRQDGGRSASSVVLGVGDDAALLQPAAGMELAVSTDLLLEGRHFRAGADARKLGHKALAVNLSDMAAMGAAPRWATLALALPAADEAWLDGFAKGFFALAQRFGVELIGGDTTRAPHPVRSRSASPSWARCRAGSRSTGPAPCPATTSGCRENWAARRSGSRSRRTRPRRGAWTSPSRASSWASGCAGSPMRRSMSRTDSRRISGTFSSARASAPWSSSRACPRFQGPTRSRCLPGGDDYELVFTARQERRAEVEALARELNLPLARVGSIQKGEAVLQVLDAERSAMPLARGFDHFAP